MLSGGNVASAKGLNFLPACQLVALDGRQRGGFQDRCFKPLSHPSGLILRDTGDDMRQREKAITGCSDELESLPSGRTSETGKKGATLNYGRATGLQPLTFTVDMPEKE